MSLSLRTLMKYASFSKFALAVAALLLVSVAVVSATPYAQQEKASAQTSEQSEESLADPVSDSVINILDLSYILGQWGSDNERADLNRDGVVDFFDLSLLFRDWGVQEQIDQSEEVPAVAESDDDASPPEAPEQTEVSGSVDYATGQFFVSGSQIIDPSGNVFYPIGVNVNGPESWNNRYESFRTVGHSDDALRWGFNTVRLTMCTGQGDRNGGDYPDDSLEAIIDEYTAKNIVVMLEGRYDCNKAGTPPTDSQYSAVRDEFVYRAAQYADNPYVWFNLFNEPTYYTNDYSHETWKRIHTDLARDIRATGSTSMIVVNGSNFGQENHWQNGYSLTDETDSAILKYGSDVAQAAGQCNIAFSFHVYTEWKNGEQAMRDYIQKVQDSGKALLITEVGRTEDYNTATGMRVLPETNHFNVATAYQVAPEMGVGLLAWHGAATDTFNLVDDQNGYLAYWAANEDFSNLTEFGQLHRNLSENIPSFDRDSDVTVPSCLL